MKKLIPYSHPFLFALYPVVFLYSKNVFEYSESSIVVPLIFSLMFAILVFFVVKLILKDLARTAIISSFVIFASLSFGRILDITGLKDLKIAGTTIDSGIILSVILVIILFLIFKALKKFANNLSSTNQYLTVIASVLLILALVPIISFEAKTGRIFKASEPTPQSAISEPRTANPNLPDIYYFIFDRYAGPKSQKEEFGIDNSEFFDFLKEKGFYVAEDSTTNYPKTFLSLASSLNMEYLDDLTKKTNGGASPDESLGTPLIRNSKVINFLKSQGYYTVNVGPSMWGPTSKNPYADKNYVMEKGTYPLVDAFGTGFLNMTIAEPIFKIIFADPLDVSEDPYNNEHRRLALFELNAAEQAIKLPGPKFVFIHVLLPHDPFVFDANCNPIDEAEVEKHDHVYNYTQQLTCTNKKLGRLISAALNTDRKPIIMLQSDEGPFPMKTPIPPKQGWGTATTASLKEKFPILNAMYFPDKDASTIGVYPSITPVNSFRVLFNAYFGTDLPLLPDRNYVFYDSNNFYKFTDVTERIK